MSELCNCIILFILFCHMHLVDCVSDNMDCVATFVQEVRLGVPDVSGGAGSGTVIL